MPNNALKEELAKLLRPLTFGRQAEDCADAVLPFVQALQVEWAEKVSTERVDAAVKAERKRCLACVNSDKPIGAIAAAIREGNTPP